MIVPKYWSESKATTKSGGHQITVRRFGWSNESEADAYEHANRRLDEALKELKETGNVRRIDHKVSYNGSEGVPIREEVVSTHQDVVISRNSYGALCLNTPDVMFADVDLDFSTPTKLVICVFIITGLLSGAAALVFEFWALLVAGIIGALMFSGSLARFVNQRVFNSEENIEHQALERIKEVSQRNKSLHMRVYQTTMGFRVLFMEGTYDPTSEAAAQLLKSIASDRVYIQMCRNQRCFRARVSPKPWRIGVGRLRPRPGVWPISPERMQEREQWVQRYEKKSRHYSTCTFVMKLGADTVHEKAEHVRKLHDELCKVNEVGAEVV